MSSAKQASEFPDEDAATAAASQPATLGAIFAAARQRAGLTVDDAARILRLRPTVLREIENDDLRSFDHATYARMTLLSYARLLRLPEETVRPWLPKPSNFSTSDFGYLNRLVEGAGDRAEAPSAPEAERPQSSSLGNTLRVFFALCLLIGLAYGYLLWRNLGRLQTTGNATAPAAAQSDAASQPPSPAPAATPAPPQPVPVPPTVPSPAAPDGQAQPAPPEASPDVAAPPEQPPAALEVRPALPVVAPTPETTPAPSPAASPRG